MKNLRVFIIVALSMQSLLLAMQSTALVCKRSDVPSSTGTLIEYLNPLAVEPLTSKTYSQYLKDKTQTAPVALLARIVTEKGVSYCDVELLNKFRFNALYPQIIGTKHDQRDPLTKLPLQKEVHYFYTHSISDVTLHYLGSDTHITAASSTGRVMEIFLVDMLCAQKPLLTQYTCVENYLPWHQALRDLKQAYGHNFGYGGFVQDFDTAFKKYKLLTDQSVNTWARAIATAYCADMILFGEATEVGLECKELYQNLTEQTDSPWAQALAHYRLGAYYFNVSDDDYIDYKNRIFHLNYAAEQDVHNLVKVYALFELGGIYSSLDYEYCDEKKAFLYFTLAARQETSRAIKAAAIRKLKKILAAREMRQAGQKSIESVETIESML